MNIQKAALENAMWQSRKMLTKVQNMQLSYWKTQKKLSNDRIQIAQKALDAVCHKFTLLNIHLEALWSISSSARNEILLVMENSINSHQWNDLDKTLGSLSLEAFLFQARSFLDIYQKYCLAVMNKDVVQMSKDDFIKTLNKVDIEYIEKAQKIKTYFEDIVYGEPVKNFKDADIFECCGWGTIVRELRNKIAHQNFIKYSYEGSEVLRQVKLDWPSLRGVTYERFAQLIDNGLFALITSASEILYEQEWVSG